MTSDAPTYSDKFIAFIDILGFKSLVTNSEAGVGLPLSELLGAVKMLGTKADRDAIEKYGPTTCPESKKLSRDIGFQISPFSDCVVISTEVSSAGVINIVGHCWKAAISLLTKGIMVRGYITRGSIYHQNGDPIGSGYQYATEMEKSGVTAFKRVADERGTPFIEIDQSVTDYIRNYGDSCVKEMFSRYAKSDGTVNAIFPFQRLSHSFGIGGIFGDEKFDPNKEKMKNNEIRKWILALKKRVSEHVDHDRPDAVMKAEHYIAALDDQLRVCEQTDDMIDRLMRPLFG